jgi:hypothetical protein
MPFFSHFSGGSGHLGLDTQALSTIRKIAICHSAAPVAELPQSPKNPSQAYCETTLLPFW